MTANQISFYKAKEEAKHYRRSDKEQKRHNTMTESISSESNWIQKWFNEQNAAHLVRSDAINQAHYSRMDLENQRHNQAVEQEAQRHNVTSESIDYVNAQAATTRAEGTYKSAEAAERNAATNAYLALDPYGVEGAKSQNTRTNTIYIPKYFELQKYLNYSQIVKNASGAVNDVIGAIGKGIGAAGAGIALIP